MAKKPKPKLVLRVERDHSLDPKKEIKDLDTRDREQRTAEAIDRVAERVYKGKRVNSDRAKEIAIRSARIAEERYRKR